MANICDNTLKVVFNKKETCNSIKEWFNKNYSSAIIKYEDNENLDITFESKWTFPVKEMDNLYDSITDKNDINMTCLSVEWGNYYCTFHICDENGWTTY